MNITINGHQHNIIIWLDSNQNHYTLQKSNYYFSASASGDKNPINSGINKHNRIANLYHIPKLALAYPKASVYMESALLYLDLIKYVTSRANLIKDQKSGNNLIEFNLVKLHYRKDKYIQYQTQNMNVVNFYDIKVCNNVPLKILKFIEMKKKASHCKLKRNNGTLNIPLKIAYHFKYY